MKFRKLPVVIEVLRRATAAEIVETWEGPMQAGPGDWIVRGTRGELYPVKDVVFREVYEPVDQEAAEAMGKPVPNPGCWWEANLEETMCPRHLEPIGQCPLGRKQI
jgi:hypothetical protein